jgi:GntR family transcriptional regulator, transcriptional repressor for pyruvate dehydrogenase complex
MTYDITCMMSYHQAPDKVYMIKRRKLSQEFVDELLAWLKIQQLTPGTKIPIEDELANMFNVSRTTVREGVKSLVAIGVLETRRGIGTFAKNPQPGPLRYFNGADQRDLASLLIDLLEFRIIVEPETAALAALRRTPADLVELHRCVEELKKAVSTEVTIKIPEDLGFHLALARASANSALLDTSSMIARFYEDDLYPAHQEDVIEHQAIFEAIQTSNPELARERMHFHLNHQRDKYQNIVS